MKFNDMPYTRPNADALTQKARELTGIIAGAKSFEEADKAYNEYCRIMDDVSTDLQICYIRHTINTEDAFYDAENDYSDEISPKLAELANEVNSALVNSPFKADFAKKYGDLLIRNIEIALKVFSPEIIPDMQEENKLVSEYVKLISSAQIPFDGGVYTLSQLSPHKQAADNEKRLSAWKADGGFFTENGEKLDEIYDKLVKVRTRIAQKLGYKNFVEPGYYRMGRNCYTADDVAKFRKAVIKYIVPVADALYREQAKRTGLAYPLNHSDKNLAFRSGNPKPCGSADDILAHAKKFYHELSKETAEFIDFMYENELLDVLSKKGKAGGGYCTGLERYESTFVFANFNGTQGDVEVMTHEAGHAFAGQMAFKNKLPSQLRSPSLESCECHSMSMEFFAWPWEEGFFGADTDKFYYSHLFGAVTFIPYGTMVDHFQHIVYENPELTPAQRHEKWRELSAIYMPWLAVDGVIPFYGDGKAWQRQSHIYEVPFYYIDYCLAQTVALEFWAIMQNDRKDAWERYMRFVNLGGTRTFTELVEAAGLFTPFGDDALRNVAEVANKWLSGFDSEKLK
ncbi:MAG: M3 family oligoendopeptidase [Clostridia bacterium]|nr:M3 family oligoendopeptidase [Clostridia bacterium]